MVDYNTLLDNVQSAFYSVISGDSTVKKYAKKIVDGFPASDIFRYTAFPLIIVHTPEISEENVANNIDMFRQEGLIEIEIFAKTESAMRKTADAVRRALRADLLSSNSIIAGSYVAGIKVTRSDYDMVQIGNIKTHHYRLIIEFYVHGGRS